MKRKLQVLLSLVCTAVLFSSCASGDTQKENVVPKDEGRKVNERQGNLDVLNPIAYSDVSGIKLEPGSYISIIGKSSDSEFWNEVKAGAERAAEDLNAALGYKGEDKIKVNYSGSAKGENIEEQINILDEELARNPVAVGIAIIDATACEVQFDLAAENGIPIVAFDSGSDYKNIQAMCSANNSEIGKTGATKLASIIDDAGDVALFVHDKESTSAKLREQGFLKEMQENHPNIKVPLIYHLDDLEEMSKTIAAEKNKNKKEGEKDILPEEITQTEAIRYVLKKNPNIKGCFSTNITVNEELLKVLGEEKDLKVVSVDGGESQLKALKDGKVSGLIVQNPYGMGYATVVSAARASLGMGNQAFIDSGFIWVTKDNMNKKTIKRMLY
ncbi:MAG: substrate-binding domain-containing protein [Lachnospiraceae bacterium]|nr:substrate-binding domain-containing protein [Lachnospiraceae bacterium]